MNRICHVILFCITVLNGSLYGQALKRTGDTLPFNYSYWNGVADRKQLTGKDRQEFIASHKRDFREEQQQLYGKGTAPASEPVNGRLQANNQVHAGPCTNIDFETGNLSGWTRSSGYHPGYNATGCCPNANGQQIVITNTAALDPFGGFPMVFPGGNASLRLGNSGVNGQADRLFQTFFVTQANANFTYRYAVVLNDANHTVAQQPFFEIVILDTLGVPVICTQYTVAAGANVPGYFTSTLTANNAPVRYKPWTSVAMDLTPLIGQNVTLRFTTYDCSLGGHFGYAYVDGLCTSFDTSVADTTCAGTPKQMCAPVGFLTYSWTGPGMTNNPSQCVSPTLPGTYTCQTLLVPGCPGPSFVHTLTTLPKPVISFTSTSAGNCSNQYSFTSAVSISSGSITSYLWSFGDNTTSNQLHPVHNFAVAGTYVTKLRVTAASGCMDSVMQTIVINPRPVLNFSPPSNCINTVVQFTNTSSISAGSIASYSWNLGNGVTSTLTNPATTYTASGTYTVTLFAISNLGCTTVLSQTLGIHPPPVLSFSASPLCDINGTTFSPSTSTAIASGSLTGFQWNFGDGNTSTTQSPVHIYASPGTYTVTFTGTSNHACVQTVTNSFIIAPTPSVAFNTYSLNACSPNFSFTNNSQIAAGTISYSWAFGGAGSSTLTSPTFTFPSNGTYTVRLIGSSNLGCTDTALQVISIHPYPVVNLNIPSPCQNAIFSCSPSAVSGSVTNYLWNFGDPGPANTSTLQNPTHAYPSTGTYTIQLNILSNLNCPSGYTTVIDVYPNPTAIFTQTGAGACDLPYSFTNSSSVTAAGGNSVTACQWNFGGSGSSSAFSPTFSFPGAGSHSVSMIAITNRNCMDTAYSVVTIHPRPVLSVSVLPTCLNTPVVYNASFSISPAPDPAASVVSHTWNLGDNNSSNSAVPLAHTYPASGQYVVTYSATSNQGCVSTVSSNLVIHPQPVSTLSVANLCHGDITTFVATSTVTAPSTVTDYYWDFGNGAVSTLSNAAYTYPASGNYLVTFSATSSFSCVTVNTLNLSIYALPVVTFTANNACLNATTSFTSTSTVAAPSSPASFTWYPGGGASPLTGQPANYVYPNPGIYNPTLIVMSNHGCVKTGTGTVITHPLPAPAFTAPATCMNSAVLFANTSTITAGSINSYTWDFGNGTGSFSMNPANTYTAQNNYTVTLAATSDQGCVSGYSGTVLVYPQAVPDFSFSNLCHQDNTQFASITASLVPPASTVTTYSWDFGDSGTGTGATTSHTYSGSGNYNVSFSVVTNNNCLSSITRTLNIYPLPVVNFSAAGVCLNGTTSFINTSTIAPAPASTLSTFSWAFGDGGASTLPGPAHTYSAYGSYTPTLTVVSSQGCSKSNTFSAVVHPLPVINFVAPSACVNNSIQFANTSTVASGAINSYTWNFGDGSGSFANAPAHTFTAHNSYTVTLAAETDQGCSANGVRSLSVYPYPEVTVTPMQNGCPNDQVSIFAAFSIPATAIGSYTWNFGNNTTPVPVNSATILPFTTYTYNQAGTYTLQLSVKSTGNCVTNSYTTITIYPKPVPAFSVLNLCFRDTTKFTNNSSISSGSITGFHWDFGDLAATSNSHNPVHVFSKDSTFMVVLTATSNPEPGLSCVSTVTGSIVIHPLPRPSFSASPVCLGKNTVFINSTPASSVTGWAWDFDSDGIVNSTFGSPVFIYPSAGDFTVSLSATNNFNCRDSYTNVVTVYPNPAVSFTLTPTCFGEPTFLSSNTLSGNTYTWAMDGSSYYANHIPTHTFSAAGVHTVQLSVADNTTGCSSSTSATLVVDDLPVVSFSATSVCLDSLTQFINQSYIPNGNIVKYRWDYEGNGWDDSSATAFIPPVKYASGGQFTFRLWAMSGLGCKSEKSGKVRVYDKPGADFRMENTCAGDKVKLINLSASADGTISAYLWDFNADHTVDAQGAEPVYTYTAAGTYFPKLRVLNQYGCADVRSYSLAVHPKAVPKYSADKTNGCPPLCVRFSDLSTISGGTFTATWHFGDQSPAKTAPNPEHCFETGIYDLSLKLVSDKNCVSELKHPGYVTAHPVPVAAFNSDPEEVDEEEPVVNVTSAAEGAVYTRYYINDGVTYSRENFTHTFRKLENRILPMIVQIVSNEYGCPDTTFRVLEVRPGFSIYFPNVFTPNGDDLNDGFGAKGVGIRNFAMQIYDRWGHLVFSSNDILHTWDGRSRGSREPIKQDVYVWKAQVTDIFQRKHDFVGRVTLLK